MDNEKEIYQTFNALAQSNLVPDLRGIKIQEKTQLTSTELQAR